MTQYLSLSPLISVSSLTVLCVIALVCVVLLVIFRKRSAWLRFIVFLSLLAMLANPMFFNEFREPTKSVVAVIVDKSQSQRLGQRMQDVNEAVAKLKHTFTKMPQFETRFVDVEPFSFGNDGTATKLFSALTQSLADVPPAQIAGAVFITDGQVDDIPDKKKIPNFNAPINALITGKDSEFDRSIRFIDPPRFALAAKGLNLPFIIENQGRGPASPADVPVSVFIGGKKVSELSAPIGKVEHLAIDHPNIGDNIVELKIPPLEGELSQSNDNAVAVVNVVRENLRVLLVSGKPHNGERTWRDLLKSDPNIDLIHFTILRPPEKVDGTPINQLSLIVFPTTELFVDKIKDFDLVIFDRYQHYDVLPLIYYDYLAQYVLNGGALLMAVGPEYAGNASLAKTPLISALPALPDGEIITKGFTPTLTDLGKRHPVTRGLAGYPTTPAKWGRWFRQIGVQNNDKNSVLMTGAENRPLLLLNHAGNGRVGMLLSDEGWLWARGFEGGGPYATLYRRIAHWLMKQPELEEEALTANSSGFKLSIRRQTLKNTVTETEIISPTGRKQSVDLQKQQDGVYTAVVSVDEVGLYRIVNGDLQTLVHVGPLNAPEFLDVISTTKKLAPIVENTGGEIMRVEDVLGQPPDQTFKITSVNGGHDHAIVLKPSRDTRLISVSEIPLYSGIAALLVTLIFLASTWYCERY